VFPRGREMTCDYCTANDQSKRGQTDLLQSRTSEIHIWR